MTTAPAPTGSPARARGSEGAGLAAGMAAGALATAVAVWFRPLGLLAVAAVALWLLWRRPRQAAAGALVGCALPLITASLWTSTAWPGFACAALLAAGLALSLSDGPGAAPPRLSAAAAAPAGLIAGAFAGFVLVSSLFLVGYLPMVLAVCAVAWAAGRAALPWTVAGLSAIPLWVGLSNLGGPGVRCGSSGADQWCSELADPVPFLLLGGALLAIGVVGALVERRRRSVGVGHA